KPPLA
ncbi:ABC transporter substrate-binding domain protein, partial [Vibrio parahaemolyticus V-223/04]